MKSGIIPFGKSVTAQNLENLDFRLLNIAYLNESSAKKSPRDVMDNFKALVMISGSAKVHIGKNIYFTAAGDCVIFAPGSLYYARIDEGQPCRLVAMNFSVEGKGGEEKFRQLLGIKDIMIFQSLVPEHMRTHLTNIYAGCYSDRVDQYYDALLSLKRLIAMAINHSKSLARKEYYAPTAEAVVLQCHRYIINNMALPVAVESLCRLCNVSQSYLYRCFKQVFDISSKEFIQNTKLEYAAGRLLQTDKTVAGIAADCGYANGYRFSAAFKKKYGVSPAGYRKLHSRK